MRVELVHVPKIVRVAGVLDSVFATAMPMGIFSLADRLDRARHDVEILHVGAELRRDRSFDLASALAESLPRVVGFTLNWHHQLADVLAQAEAVRQALSQVNIVVGGLTASVFDREILESCPAIDAVVRGDAEHPLEEYVGSVEWDLEPETVPNLTWRKGKEIVRNELSWFANAKALSDMDFGRLDLLRNADHYSGEPWEPLWNVAPSKPSRRTFHLPIGRGCNWDCAFCSGCREGHRRFTGRAAPVFRSAESVLHTIEQVLSAGVDSLYACYDPYVASRTEYFLDLFERIRGADLRPAIEFECFSLPEPEFVRAFARTFDRETSKLVLSPGTAMEENRYIFHGSSYANADVEHTLSMARGCGIRSHVCFSIYPPEGWAEARALARWQQSLVERFECSLFVCPIEMEPWAPWQLDPERYELSDVRTSFDQYLKRHQQVGHQERAWAAEIGYATEELAARTLLLRSETAGPERFVWQALSGLWRRAPKRVVLGPYDALDAMLEVVGRWQPGEIAFVLAGQLDDDAKEAVARRITEASHSVAGLFFLSTKEPLAGTAWQGVHYAVESFRAPLPDRSVLTAKSFGDRRDASVFARLAVENARGLAEDLRAARCLLVDSCRFRNQPCPAVTGHRLVFAADGGPRGCAALEIERRPGEGWDELVSRLQEQQKEVESRRGCADCPAHDRCARCPAPDPFKEKEYCSFVIEDTSFAEFADGLLVGPPGPQRS